jgi:SpoVK/Ycf46/Vps4 family AAA+-type ATPase
MMQTSTTTPIIYHAADIPEVQLTKSQREASQKIWQTASYFFKYGRSVTTTPFRGFVLEGDPACGKTEIVKQAVRKLGVMLGDLSMVSLYFVDTASIAAPRWGDAETALRDVFNTDDSQKRVVLFDDIDCLMMKRGLDVAREWHYSINAAMFHRLDDINPRQLMVTATTNRPDLIDDALRSRLYSLKISVPTQDELLKIATDLLEDSGLEGDAATKVLAKVEQDLGKLAKPTIRDIQHTITLECIEGGFWSTS